MEGRYERVASAQAKTFDWIFDSSSQNQRWSSFAEFLQGPQNLYWITGKPGAGKSTLMKFIGDEPRTKDFLSVWAGGRTFSSPASTSGAREKKFKCRKKASFEHSSSMAFNSFLI
jgi:ABC-type lipoprotein export system ATPase subunit